MQVMSRILDEGLTRATIVDKSNWQFLGGRWKFPMGGGGAPDLYLAGFGALFMIDVGFPLCAPAEDTEAKEPESTTDQVWTQTRREMLEPAAVGHEEKPAAAYDARKVEDLKRTIIESLKHAVNIRTLGSDPWVVVCVQSQSEGGAMGAFVFNRMVIATNGVATNGAVKPSEGPARGTGASKLIIRANRADIAAFAKGELNPEQFQQKVQVMLY